MRVRKVDGRCGVGVGESAAQPTAEAGEPAKYPGAGESAGMAGV
jgi:hypothetical protein